MRIRNIPLFVAFKAEFEDLSVSVFKIRSQLGTQANSSSGRRRNQSRQPLATIAKPLKLHTHHVHHRQVQAARAVIVIPGGQEVEHAPVLIAPPALPANTIGI